MIVKLDSPLPPTGNGSAEVTELDLRLEELHGNDIIQLEGNFRRLYKGEYVPIPNLDSRYHIMVAGHVSGRNPLDLSKQLTAPDFTAVCTAVSNFLMKAG